MKIIEKEPEVDESEFSRKMVQEIWVSKIMATKPCCVKFIDGKIEGSVCYMVFRKINGVSLTQFIEQVKAFDLLKSQKFHALFINMLQDILVAFKGL